MTIANLQRSIEFYTTHVRFQFLLNFEPNRALLSNGTVSLVLGEPYLLADEVEGGVINEHWVGLDYLSFAAADHQSLEAAAAYFDTQGIERGEIRDLGSTFAIYVMAFRDPDNIQLEMTAPYSV